MNSALYERSGGQCELCTGTDSLDVFLLDSDHEVIVCGVCLPQIEGEITDFNHWYCLQGSIWSEVGSVQALSWRMLSRLQDQAWAVDALDAAFLEPDVMALVGSDSSATSDDEPLVVDSNGSRLHTGDSVTLIKDLDVKGANFTAKRGTMVKNIRLGTDPTHVEGRVNKMSIMLKTCFLKRSNG
jgi:protein PhnA